jgi:hypothetical protein
MVMAGAVFLNCNADHGVKINTDCTVDNQWVNLYLHKPKERLRWTSLSKKAFDIHFKGTAGTPCMSGADFKVPPSGKSPWCDLNLKADTGDYTYSITESTNACSNDPGVTVKDGRGNIPPK